MSDGQCLNSVFKNCEEETEWNGTPMINNLSLFPIPQSYWKVIGAIKSKCRRKLYNNNVKMNSAAIIKESREIPPKTIQICIQKSKL